MTDEEIKAMVREAGFVPDWAVENCHEQFKRLVAFVAERAAAAEREACANVCDDIADTNKWSDAVAAAEAIRARSKA